MSNLKRNANRFLFRNRNKGIPNLMLYIGIGSLVVFVISLFNGNVPALLRFDAASILSGQVWRLFSYPFTFLLGYSNPIFMLLALYFYYWIGKILENTWGTLKFNLYYFCGLLLTDLAGILLYVFLFPIYISASYINVSLFLAVATLIPEQRVYLFMIIPIKMRWMALVDLALTALEIVLAVTRSQTAYTYGFWIALVVYGTAPLIALMNYFLFFGRNVKNLFVPRRTYQQPPRRPAPEPRATPNPNWANNYRGPSGQRPYRHKCTVCGRTDTDCPDLEFRYCSKCAGYFCYCIDHINNHTHVQ